MKLLLSLLPLILVAVVGIVSVMSPNEREKNVKLRSEAVVEVVNTHNAFNLSSSTPFLVHTIQTLPQSVSLLFFLSGCFCFADFFMF